MTDEAPISREMALRVGLAARALPEISAAQLLGVLDSAVGLPLREAKLKKLTPKKLREAANGGFDEIEGSSLKAALAELLGDNAEDPDLPEIDAGAGDGNDAGLSDSIQVAIASNKAARADGHFGSCARFLIYQVNATDQRLIDIRATSGCPEEADKNAWRSELISDCQLVYVGSIGGPAAAKVVRAGVHPIKLPPNSKAVDAPELLAGLRTMLAGNPPPWLAKAMGHGAEERVRFERSEEEEMAEVGA